ncbi:protein of unknown function [Methylorubrum extorquens]|uniref:Uncharacterized protein n=1 Tax=Methylorubrum extorquens TaxID=408 RepID=A0A2N9AIF4_METEX|nr:protein of unknown function [Methylorubrum extorquens]
MPPVTRWRARGAARDERSRRHFVGKLFGRGWTGRPPVANPPPPNGIGGPAVQPPHRGLGRIAQLVEQLTLNQRVLGSNPSAPTKLPQTLNQSNTYWTGDGVSDSKIVEPFFSFDIFMRLSLESSIPVLA